MYPCCYDFTTQHRKLDVVGQTDTALLRLFAAKISCHSCFSWLKSVSIRVHPWLNSIRLTWHVWFLPASCETAAYPSEPAHGVKLNRFAHVVQRESAYTDPRSQHVTADKGKGCLTAQRAKPLKIR